MEKSSTAVFVTFTKDKTLAPPDFPLFLDAMAKRILYISLPSGVPVVGFSSSSAKSSASSDFREGYILVRLLISFSQVA